MCDASCLGETKIVTGLLSTYIWERAVRSLLFMYLSIYVLVRVASEDFNLKKKVFDIYWRPHC